MTPLLSKWLLTLSNLIALFPLWNSRNRSDSLVLLYACCASLLHHSAETRYYEPSLWQWSSSSQWWFLRNDQMGALIAILGLGSWELLRRERIAVGIGFSLMLLSEIVMFLPFLSIGTKILLRTLLHLGWHFLSLGYMAWKAIVSPLSIHERLSEWLMRRMLGIVE